MIHLAEDLWAEWCPCGTHPTPPDGIGDSVVQVSHGAKKGTIYLMHPECVKQRRRKRDVR